MSTVTTDDDGAFTRTLSSRNPRRPLRAKGRLSYEEFISLVERLWMDAHPDIPIIPSGDGDPAHYPCIVYGLELRKTHPDEPKLRYRETWNRDSETGVLFSGQRFQNMISFTVYTQSGGDDPTRDGPKVAERIIEVFEDFMTEFTPVFKEMGVSEFVYGRRYADSELSRSGVGIVRRSVVYMVTLEKIVTTSYQKLERIVIDARAWLEEFRSKQHYIEGNWEDTTEEDSSRYHFTHTPAFYVSEESLTNNTIVMPETSFRIGDMGYVFNALSNPLPNGITPGYYMIFNIIGTVFSDDIQYELKRVITRGDDPELEDVTINGLGHGRWVWAPDSKVETLVTDEFTSNSTGG